MNKTKIEWCETTWNPIRGCTEVSPGCKNCYAKLMAARFASPRKDGKTPLFDGFAIFDNKVPKWTGKVEVIWDKMDEPKKWKEPSVIFISMSDPFHETLGPKWYHELRELTVRTMRHTYILLTKRSDVAMEVSQTWEPSWPPNVVIGASVENDLYCRRIVDLINTPVTRRMLSLEPLLGAVNLLHLNDMYEVKESIHQVVIGGESWTNARECKLEQIEMATGQCDELGIPYFVKQLGSKPTWNGKPLNLREPAGKDPDEWPKFIPRGHLIW